MSHLILLLMTINTIIFIFMKHPMSMGMSLLLQTIFSCIYLSSISKNSWFSYILFLIFIGGMLILFIYMSSLASNEKFFFSINLLIFFMFTLCMTLSISMNDDFWTHYFSNNEMNIMNDIYNLLKENFLTMSKMYDFPNNMIMIFLINYLLLTLIIVVKITNLFMGPLRPKN